MSEEESSHICDTIEFACISLDKNVWGGVLLVLVLCAFSKAIGVWIDHVKEHSGHMTRVVLPIVLEEMTILGLFSFILFLLQYFSLFSEEFATYVDFFHISLFVTLLFYLGFLGVVSWGRYWHLKSWYRFERIIINCTPEEIESYRSSLRPLYNRNFKLFSKMRSEMVRNHGLPQDFKYALYLEFVVNYLFEKMVRVGWRNGAIMIVWLIFVDAAHSISGKTASEDDSPDTNDYLFPISFMFNSINAVFGLYCLYFIKRSIEKVSSDSITEPKALEREKREDSLHSVESKPMEHGHTNIFEAEGQLEKLVLASFEESRVCTCDTWYGRMFPILFERDNYRSMFPFRAPDSFLYIIQIFFLSQGLTWTVFFFILIFVESSYAPWGDVCFLVPAILGIIVFPIALPKFALLRYSGPLVNQTLTDLILQRKLYSEYYFPDPPNISNTT